MTERWFPHVTVAAIAQINGKYLLVEESSASGLVINQPAGHVEKGESLVDAVIRETREETGWTFVPDYLCGIYQFVAGNGETYFRHTFVGKLTTHDAELELDPAISSVIWLDSEALGAINNRHRSQVVAQCVADFESGQKRPLNLVQKL